MITPCRACTVSDLVTHARKLRHLGIDAYENVIEMLHVISPALHIFVYGRAKAAIMDRDEDAFFEAVDGHAVFVDSVFRARFPGDTAVYNVSLLSLAAGHNIMHRPIVWHLVVTMGANPNLGVTSQLFNPLLHFTLQGARASAPQECGRAAEPDPSRGDPQARTRLSNTCCGAAHA